jgi:hypothetical protein
MLGDDVVILAPSGLPAKGKMTIVGGIIDVSCG